MVVPQKNDIAKLHDIYNQMAGNCFCLLGESAVVPIRTALKLFPHEFEEALAKSSARHAVTADLGALRAEPYPIGQPGVRNDADVNVNN
jgi:hypothetical protein